MMIDAHAHLHDKKFDDDRAEMIGRFFDGGGAAIVGIGTSVHESEAALDLARQYERVYATVGLHPHVFNGGERRDDEWMEGIGADSREDVRMDALKAAVERLEQMAADRKVVAIGEIGIDYFLPGEQEVNLYQKKWQRTGFVVQVALAKKLGLPVVVHCRPEDVALSDAYFDCATIIADHPQVAFVLHCYMGNEAVTEKFLALENVHFSFTGNVTFSKSDDDQMSTVIGMIPVDRMMIETDAPYLTPVPYRGKRNEPLYVRHVAERIAVLEGLVQDDVCAQTAENTKSFFDIR